MGTKQTRPHIPLNELAHTVTPHPDIYGGFNVQPLAQLGEDHMLTELAEDERRVAALFQAAPDLLWVLGLVIPPTDWDADHSTVGDVTCRWCGREYDRHEEYAVGDFCPEEDCPGFTARTVLAKLKGTP